MMVVSTFYCRSLRPLWLGLLVLLVVVEIAGGSRPTGNDRIAAEIAMSEPCAFECAQATVNCTNADNNYSPAECASCVRNSTQCRCHYTPEEFCAATTANIAACTLSTAFFCRSCLVTASTVNSVGYTLSPLCAGLPYYVCDTSSCGRACGNYPSEQGCRHCFQDLVDCNACGQAFIDSTCQGKPPKTCHECAIDCAKEATLAECMLCIERPECNSCSGSGLAALCELKRGNDVPTTYAKGSCSASFHQWRPRSCQHILIQKPGSASGVYTIYPDDGPGMRVFCDMETDGGGWIAYTRRFDGKRTFSRGWAAYKYGFGPVGGSHWLGNDNAHRLSAAFNTLEIRWEFVDAFGYNTLRKGDNFTLGNETQLYQVTELVDSLNLAPLIAWLKGRVFSTHDRDNDPLPGSCAALFGGGWWYGGCHTGHITGNYQVGYGTGYANRIDDLSAKGDFYGFAEAHLLLREYMQASHYSSPTYITGAGVSGVHNVYPCSNSMTAWLRAHDAAAPELGLMGVYGANMWINVGPKAMQVIDPGCGRIVTTYSPPEYGQPSTPLISPGGFHGRVSAEYLSVHSITNDSWMWQVSVNGTPSAVYLHDTKVLLFSTSGIYLYDFHEDVQDGYWPLGPGNIHHRVFLPSSQLVLLQSANLFVLSLRTSTLESLGMFCGQLMADDEAEWLLWVCDHTLRHSRYQHTVGFMNHAWAVQFTEHPIAIALATTGFVLFSNGTAIGYALEDGNKLWQKVYTPVSSPVVLDSSVELQVIVLTTSNRIFTLNSTTGDVLWTQATLDPTQVLIYGDRAIVNQGPGLRGFYIACDLDREPGTWIFGTGGHVGSAAAVEDELLTFANYEGKVFVLQRDTGTLVCSYDTGPEVWGTPAWGNGTIIAGNWGGTVTAIYSHNCSVAWTSTQGGMIYSPLVVAQGLVVGSVSGSHTFALDVDTGIEAWRLSGSLYLAAAQVSSDEASLYLGFLAGDVVKVETLTGSVRWRTGVGPGIIGSVAVTQGRVFAASRVVTALDMYNGNIVWTTPLPHHSHASLTAYGDCLYIGNEGGHLYSLRMEDGAIVWRFQAFAVVRSAALVLSSAVIFGAYDANLYLLDPATGEEKWSLPMAGHIQAAPTKPGNALYIAGSSRMQALRLPSPWTNETQSVPTPTASPMPSPSSSPSPCTSVFCRACMFRSVTATFCSSHVCMRYFSALPLQSASPSPSPYCELVDPAISISAPTILLMGEGHVIDVRLRGVADGCASSVDVSCTTNDTSVSVTSLSSQAVEPLVFRGFVNAAEDLNASTPAALYCHAGFEGATIAVASMEVLSLGFQPLPIVPLMNIADRTEPLIQGFTGSFVPQTEQLVFQFEPKYLPLEGLRHSSNGSCGGEICCGIDMWLGDTQMDVTVELKGNSSMVTAWLDQWYPALSSRPAYHTLNVTQHCESWRDGSTYRQAFTVACPPHCPGPALGMFPFQECESYPLLPTCREPTNVNSCGFGSAGNCSVCPVGALCPGMVHGALDFALFYH